jgi:hypothetical protein
MWPCNENRRRKRKLSAGAAVSAENGGVAAVGLYQCISISFFCIGMKEKWLAWPVASAELITAVGQKEA